MNNKIYFCYAQSMLGLLNSEAVVDSMRVCTNEEQINKWLKETVEEFNLLGFTPDEEIEDFMGKTDYILAISKGNEEIGYVNFELVCRSFELSLTIDFYVMK